VFSERKPTDHDANQRRLGNISDSPRIVAARGVVAEHDKVPCGNLAIVHWQARRHWVSRQRDDALDHELGLRGQPLAGPADRGRRQQYRDDRAWPDLAKPGAPDQDAVAGSQGRPHA
jgi:hypothetical protein